MAKPAQPDAELTVVDDGLSAYFRTSYLKGELFSGRHYVLGEDVHYGPHTYRYDGPDGAVHVWRHAFNLSNFGERSARPDDLLVLYHYTNELCFMNVSNEQQTASELFASLLDHRAHFGKGVYTTQYEPCVWKHRIRILLNNYSDGDPMRLRLSCQ